MSNFSRDYSFYLDNLDTFTFAGRWPIEFPHDDNGLDASACFKVYDSQGQIKPTREPELVSRLVTAKASVNLHIKEWAKGLAMGTLFLWELKLILADYAAPDWVLRSAQRQAIKFGWLSDEYAADQVLVYGR